MPLKSERLLLRIGLYTVIAACLLVVTSAQANCWWSGCQPSNWAVRGCPSNMTQKNLTKCQGGDRFFCCPRTCWWTGCQPANWVVRGCANSTDKIASKSCDNAGGLMYQCCDKLAGAPAPAPSPDANALNCWWSGCQPFNWAVRGCSNVTAQFNKDGCITSDKKPGTKYFCCTIPPEDIIGSPTPDYGFGDYRDYVKFLLLSSTNFSIKAASVPCTLLDPQKQAIIQIGANQGIRVCDLCPFLPLSMLRDVFINTPPMKKLPNTIVAECIGYCMKLYTCVALSFDSIQNICYLYNSTYGQFVSQWNWTTVLITQPVGMVQQWVYTRHSRVTGNPSNSSVITPPSFLGCLELCQNTRNCSQVSYKVTTGECKRFDGVNKPGFVELEFGSIAAMSFLITHSDDDIVWRFQKYSDYYVDLNKNNSVPASATAPKTIAGPCPKPTKPGLGVYYAKECVTAATLGCDRGTSCKTCYYPEKTLGYRSDLTICPDSTLINKKTGADKFRACLGICYKSNDCMAIDIDTITFDCRLVPYENIVKPTTKSRYFLQYPDRTKNLTKNNLDQFSLLLGHDLAAIPDSVALFRLTNQTDWNQCLKACLLLEPCVKVTYSKKTKACKMATNIVRTIDRRNDPNNDCSLFTKKPRLTSTELAFKRTPGWELDSKEAQFVTRNPCSSNGCNNILWNCLTICLINFQKWCNFVSVEYYGNQTICFYFNNSIDGSLRANPQREVFTKYFNLAFDLTTLNNISLFQTQDIYKCFQGNTGQNLDSLSGYQDPYQALDTSSGTVSKRSVRAKRGIKEWAKEGLKTVGGGIKDVVVNGAKDIKDTAVGFANTVADVATGDWDGAKENFLSIPIVESVVETGEDFVKVGEALTKGDWKGAGEGVLGILTSDVWDYVPGAGVAARGAKSILKDVIRKGGKSADDKAIKSSKDDVNNQVTRDRDTSNSKKDDKKSDDQNDRPGSECKDTRPKRATALGKRPPPSQPGQSNQCNKRDKCTKPDFDNVLDDSLKDCHLKSEKDKCTYECAAGYTEDPPKLTCTKVGNDVKWVPDPKCNPDTCGIPPYRIIPVNTPPPVLNIVMTTDICAFVVLLDQKRRLPIWSTALVDSMNEIKRVKRGSTFYQHPCLNNNQQANKGDYTAYWEQGHLTPANVMIYTAKSSMSSNLYINVAPQDPFTNKGYWKVIEAHVACFSYRVTSIIATGVCPDTIAKSQGSLDVPSCFWKMVCYHDSAKGQTFVIGFLTSNAHIGSDKDDREDRRNLLRVPVSQATIKAKLASDPVYATSDPWVLSAKAIFTSRPSAVGINPAECSAALNLDAVEAKEWQDAIAGLNNKTGRMKSKRDAAGQTRGCGSDEAADMAALLGLGTIGLLNFKDSDLATDDNTDEGGSLVKAAACGKRIIGYYPSWGTKPFSYRQAQRLTHVNYAFLQMNSDGTIQLGSPDLAHSVNLAEEVSTAQERLEQMLSVTKSFPNLKVLFSVGGWENSQYFSSMASSPSGRLTFISSAIEQLDRYGFDGVDIDWEYPVTGGAHEGIPDDKGNYVELMKELREALTQHQEVVGQSDPYLISFAGAAGQWTLDPGFDLPGLLKYADYANVMTYDFFGAWESKWGAYTGPPAPLYFGMPPRYSGKTNTDWAIKYYVCRSQLPHKISMGVPFYGRYWENVGAPVDGVDGCWRTAQAVNGQFVGGYVGWKDIPGTYLNNPGFLKAFHPKAKSPYAFNAGTKVYLGYEDTDSLKLKKDYAVQKNLGGIMIWAVDQDDDQLTLLNSIYDASLCDNTNPSDIKFKCSPITEKRWWTVEDGEDVAGLCGRSAPLYKGYYPVCDPDDPGYACCGAFGYCGSGDVYCKCPTCADYGTNPEQILSSPIQPTIPVAWYFLNAPDGKRGRCGKSAPTLNGQYPICNPDDANAHCCSSGGYCGNAQNFCTCQGCVDFTQNPSYKFS